MLSLKDEILFRAHKKENPQDKSEKYLFQINAIGFNHNFANLMYSCGSEGVLNFWNTKQKTKSADFNHGDNTSVTAADMHPTGKYLAYALGYDWSRGCWGLSDFNERTMIYVHTVKKSELPD